MGLNWTPERDAQLVALFNQQLPYSKIAEELGGTTKSACIARGAHIGLPTRRPSYGPRTAEQRIQFGRREFRVPNASGPKPVPEVTVISFCDLSASNCHYPLDGDENAPTVFCGSLSVAGKPYCAAHMALCYVKPEKGLERIANGL